MPTWVILRIEDISAHNRRYMYDSDEPLLVDCFDNENDFTAALHQGGIKGVAQDDYQDNNVDYENTDEIQ